MFVCQRDFGSPAERTALRFARGLCALGHSVLVMFTGDEQSAEREGALAVEGLSVHRYGFAAGRLRATDLAIGRRFTPALVHAWSAGTATMAAAVRISEAVGAPLFVHFEEDEWESGAAPPGASLLTRGGRLARRVLSVLDPSLSQQSTWLSRMEAAQRAVALDAPTPALAKEVDLRMRRACALLPVGLHEVRGVPGNAAGDGRAPVVLLCGPARTVDLPNLLLGLRALALLAERGAQLRAVHAGWPADELSPSALCAEAGLAPEAIRWLPRLPGPALASLIREATVLVEPGGPTEANRLRLPPALPEELASGIPTIVFSAGIGELLDDRQEALLTHTGEPGELADRIEEALQDAELRRRLAHGGPRAAARLFDPRRSAEALARHYAEGLARALPVP
jgi:hypothetical protein